MPKTTARPARPPRGPAAERTPSAAARAAVTDMREAARAIRGLANATMEAGADVRAELLPGAARLAFGFRQRMCQRQTEDAIGSHGEGFDLTVRAYRLFGLAGAAALVCAQSGTVEEELPGFDHEDLIAGIAEAMDLLLAATEDEAATALLLEICPEVDRA